MENMPLSSEAEHDFRRKISFFLTLDRCSLTLDVTNRDVVVRRNRDGVKLRNASVLFGKVPQ